jgi:uncharacterized protein YjiS (DUF1127 family)
MQAIVGRPPRVRGISWDHALRQSRRLVALVADWNARTRQLRSLARLDDRLLADVGLTRERQSRECSQPFWLSSGGDLVVPPTLTQSRIAASRIHRSAKS